uniref:Single-stranded DNA-binding protein n=1 Tax=Meloidogyne hapla TaxID=6305 RepID=A0A1I8BUG7_MELHA
MIRLQSMKKIGIYIQSAKQLKSMEIYVQNNSGNPSNHIEINGGNNTIEFYGQVIKKKTSENKSYYFIKKKLQNSDVSRRTQQTHTNASQNFNSHGGSTQNFDFSRPESNPFNQYTTQNRNYYYGMPQQGAQGVPTYHEMPSQGMPSYHGMPSQEIYFDVNTSTFHIPSNSNIPGTRNRFRENPNFGGSSSYNYDQNQ